VNTNPGTPGEVHDALTEVLREVSQQLLAQAKREKTIRRHPVVNSVVKCGENGEILGKVGEG
jgi:hypothetical protein